MKAIIGCALGYDWPKVKSFVLSAQRWCPKNKVIIFTDNKDLFEPLEAHNVWVVPSNKTRPWLPAYLKEELYFWYHQLPANIHPVCYRFAMYNAFIMMHNREFDGFMLTDVRDVLFSGDPFDYDWDKQRACVIRENEEMTVGKCPYNSQGVAAYDGALYTEIADKPIICSGVVIGSYIAMLGLLNEMLIAFKTAPCDRMLTDQVVLQAVAHRRPDLVHVYGSKETPVIHAGYFKSTMPDLRAFKMIHQTDRFPALHNKLIEELA